MHQKCFKMQKVVFVPNTSLHLNTYQWRVEVAPFQSEDRRDLLPGSPVSMRTFCAR